MHMSRVWCLGLSMLCWWPRMQQCATTLHQQFIFLRSDFTLLVHQVYLYIWKGSGDVWLVRFSPEWAKHVAFFSICNVLFLPVGGRAFTLTSVTRPHTCNSSDEPFLNHHPSLYRHSQSKINHTIKYESKRWKAILGPNLGRLGACREEISVRDSSFLLQLRPLLAVRGFYTPVQGVTETEWDVIRKLDMTRLWGE